MTSVDSLAGGQSRLVTQSVPVNGRTIEVRFDPQTREARLQNLAVDLGRSNVLLVDDVDNPAGPRIVDSIRVEPLFDDSGYGIDTLLRQSPELIDFLRCDAAIPAASDPNMEAIVARRCAQIRDGSSVHPR